MQATNAHDMVEARLASKGDSAKQAVKKLVAQAKEQNRHPIALIWQEITKQDKPQPQTRFSTECATGEQLSKLQQYYRAGAV